MRNFFWLKAFLLSVSAAILFGETPVRPAIGAIRWDAWMQDGKATRAVEKTLSQAKFHFRVPFFGKVDAEGKVTFPVYTQDIMDQEIRFAKKAGVDYFAYCTYPVTDAMSKGIAFHNASVYQNEVKFCLLMHQPMLTNWEEEKKLIVSYLGRKNYHTTPEGRPIVFAFESAIQRIKGRTEELVAAALAAGLARPYLVYMGWNPAQNMDLILELKFDAWSAYARTVNEQTPFSKYAAGIREAYWEGSRNVGVQSIPFVGGGWDRRPRDERPVPWDNGGKPGPGVANADDHAFTRPTAVELAAHIKDALDWSSENRALVPAQSIVMYAWNEHDEGGWLCPTWAEGGRTNTDRIDALADMLAHYTAPSQKNRDAEAGVSSFPVNDLAFWLDASDAASVFEKSGKLTIYDSSKNRNEVKITGSVRRISFKNGLHVLRLGEDGILDIPKVETAKAVSVFVVSQKTEKGGSPQARLVSAFVSGNVDWKSPSWCLALGKETDPYPPKLSMWMGSDVETRGLRLGREMNTENSKFVGDIGEVLVYGRKLSAAEIAFVRGHLTRKWNLGGSWGDEK